MIKIKHFMLLICVVGFFTACKKTDVGDVYDPVPQFKADTTAIRAFIKANNILNVKKNEQYGVFYQVIAAGTGNVTYTSTTKINVDYEGRLLNGTIFDASKGTSPTFTLGGLIPGWQIGVPYIQKGGQIRLFIPSYYGYGEVARTGIPANSVLDFTITLNDIPN